MYDYFVLKELEKSLQRWQIIFGELCKLEYNGSKRKAWLFNMFGSAKKYIYLIYNNLLWMIKKYVCVIACMVVYGWQKYALSVEDVRNNCKRVGTAHIPKKTKIFRRMAKLMELCGSVPASIVRTQQMNVIAERTQKSYNRRMDALDLERAMFEQCKHTRTQKRVKNGWSREQAGTCSQLTTTRRFATSQTFVEKRGTSVRTYTLTSYTNVVCKSYSNKY